MSERIIINGQIYRSVSEMPSDVRRLYERLETITQDDDHDGVPDAFQQDGLQSIKEVIGFIKDFSKVNQAGNKWTSEQMAYVKETDTTISVNGKTFRGVDEMPPDIRQVYQKAIHGAKMADPADFADADIYDEPWRERKRDSYFRPHDDEVIEPKYRFSQENSVLQPVNTNLGLVLVLVLSVLVCAGAGVFFFLSNGNLF
jgi:hypothetical protein